MTQKELQMLRKQIFDKMKNKEITDKEIIGEIQKGIPDLTDSAYPSASDLFLWSIFLNRSEVAMALVDMGVDIYYRTETSMFKGNALNVARSPEIAEYLLELGIKIEKNLLLRKDYWNPAIVAVWHNDKSMFFYWLKKQKEIFREDKEFLYALTQESIRIAIMMNQYGMLSCIMKEDELYNILKAQYSKEENRDSIKLYLSSLCCIEDKELEDRKKELQKILREQQHKLSK